MNKTNPLWIGIITFVTIISFIIGLLFLQDISFNKSNFTFTVIFEDVQGLNDGDSVTMLGKRIGSVSKIKLLGQKIAAELSIDNAFAFQIPVDSEIEVKSEGLLGSKYISIKPGSDLGKFIVQGETVEGMREYDFSEITPGIVPMTQDLGAFARRLKATLGENEKIYIQESLKSIKSLTNRLDSLIYDMRLLISEQERKDISNVINNINSSSESIKEFSGILNVELSKDLKKIDIILDDIHAFTKNSDSLNSIIDKLNISSSSFQYSASKLNDILNNFESGSGTLPKLLNDSTLYNKVENIVLEVNNLIQDFKDNPGRYMKAYFKYSK